MNKICLQKKIPPELSGKRLDLAASISFPEYSRSLIQKWIKDGFLTLDQKKVSQKQRVKPDQEILINVELKAEENWEAEKIPLDMIYEDQDIMVINKPTGLVVHPGAGRKSNTLLNALLYHCPELKNLPRAGIIHRLDKDTSGLLVIAKTLPARTKLVAMMQKRLIKREYETIVRGIFPQNMTIEKPIGRHAVKRKIMTVKESGKIAISHIKVIKRFKNYSYLLVSLETGRTHQIRVHLSHLNFPIVGDQTYGKKQKIPVSTSAELKGFLENFKRQALHARFLEFDHPISKKHLKFVAPLPEDFDKLLQLLQKSL
jgi:23S rRNA pseudouridine1911/1915/1917 synthase